MSLTARRTSRCSCAMSSTAMNTYISLASPRASSTSTVPLQPRSVSPPSMMTSPPTSMTWSPQCLPSREAKHFSQLLLSRYVNIVEIGGVATPHHHHWHKQRNLWWQRHEQHQVQKYKYSSHHFPITIDYGNNALRWSFLPHLRLIHITMQSIHITTLRKILSSPEPIDIRLWTRSSEIQSCTAASPSNMTSIKAQDEWSCWTLTRSAASRCVYFWGKLSRSLPLSTTFNYMLIK